MRPTFGFAFSAFALSAAFAFSCTIVEESDDQMGSTTVAGSGGSASSSAASGGSGGSGVDLSADCKTLGLPIEEFVASTDPAGVGAVAADFTVETLAGPWNFASQFSGCDNYVFINYFASTPGDQLWASEPANLFKRSAENVHYFFGSYSADPAVRSVDIDSIKVKVEAALVTLGPDQQQWWAKRVHYVTTRANEVQGSVGDYYAGFFPSVVFAFGITREQRFDAGGSLARVSGGSFKHDMQMAASLSPYYNFVYDRNKQKAAETVNDVVLIDNELVTKNNQVYEAEFPAADKMAEFDTMELDITASCGPSATDCGEWDYEAFVELCANAECDQRNQIGLWITPYARPGKRRWVVDATPFMGLLAEGGKRTFRFGMLWNMNPNTMRISFRLSNRGVGMRPVKAIPLFGGGGFNADYNDKYQPIDIVPPMSTKKVELVALISGHGQEAGNCAEWCNHEHTFTINSTAKHVKDYVGEAGQQFGCADRANEGVVPGQYGNWAPSRAAWCPGLEVKPWRADISQDLNIGSSNSIEYAGSYNGKAPVGGRIRMSSFVVYYE